MEVREVIKTALRTIKETPTVSGIAIILPYLNESEKDEYLRKLNEMARKPITAQKIINVFKEEASYLLKNKDVK